MSYLTQHQRASIEDLERNTMIGIDSIMEDYHEGGMSASEALDLITTKMTDMMAKRHKLAEPSDVTPTSA